MNLQEFINKYNGKKVDWDGAYGGQCVDLFRQYNHEVLELPQPRGVVGAADFWGNYETDNVLKENYIKIKNTLEFIPEEGDVAIWSRSLGNGYGHIAICTGKGDQNRFESFDQNWSQVSYCELVSHSYDHLYGVLRPKNMNNDSISIDKKTFEELVTKSSKYDGFKTAGFETPEQVLQSIEDRDRNIAGLKQERDTSRQELEQRRKEHNAFVAILANDDHLKTRQDENEIVSKAKTFGTIEQELEDTLDKYLKDKKSWAVTEQELVAEIARLKALLKQENVIDNYTTQELVAVILKRLVSILERK